MEWAYEIHCHYCFFLCRFEEDLDLQLSESSENVEEHVTLGILHQFCRMQMWVTASLQQCPIIIICVGIGNHMISNYKKW